MPTWLAIVIGTAAGLTAIATIWKTLIKPMAELIVLQQRAMPLLRDLTQVFATVPKPFDVLSDIISEFRTNGGSSLRDVVNRLDAAAAVNASAAEVLKIQVEASRQLAVQDREAMARLTIMLDRLTINLDRLTVKVAAGDVQRTRMEDATDRVAEDLEEAHKRADAVEGHAGEAADAASRSGLDRAA